MSIFPVADTLTQSEAAAARVANVDQMSNAAIAAFANAIALGLSNTWLPTDTTPALMLAAMGTDAKKRFDQSYDAVVYMWANDLRRAELLAACAAHGVTVNVENGLPVFPCRLPYTAHPDGTITLN